MQEDVGTLTALSIEQWEKVNAISGWLSYPAAHLSWLLLRYQVNKNISGAVVELGVYKGKFLAVLAGASVGSNKRVVGIDGFFAGYGAPMDEQWVSGARSLMQTNAGTLSPANEVAEIVKADTQFLNPDSFSGLVGGAVCFASVDAGHDAREVQHDLGLVASCLAEGGIIAADDVFNHVVPGVAEGVCKFMNSDAGTRLAAFATCGNKLFLTTKRSHQKALSFCRTVVQSFTDDYLIQTLEHKKKNDSIGFTPHFFGQETLPFLG